MFQMAPWVKTLCSYKETNLPRAAGVNRSMRIVLDARLPSKTRCGTSRRALGFHLLGRLTECERLGLGEWLNAIKSTGISFVP
jgi:hypothetical protein